MPSQNFDTISSPNNRNPYDNRRNTKTAAKNFELKNNNIYKNFKDPNEFNNQVLEAAKEKQVDNAEELSQNQEIEKPAPVEDSYYENPYNYYSDYEQSNESGSDPEQENAPEENSPEQSEESGRESEPSLGENTENVSNSPKSDNYNSPENQQNTNNRTAQDDKMNSAKSKSDLAKKAMAKKVAEKKAKQAAEKAAARAALAATSEIWIPILLIAIILIIIFFFAVAYNNPGTGASDDNGGGGTVDGNKIVQIASAEINHCESPLGSDSGPDIDYYFTDMGWTPGLPWCAAFVSWVYDKAGYSVPRTMGAVATLEYPNISVYDLGGSVDPAPGDIIVRDANGGHVGLVKSYSNGTLTVIEGNTSSGCVHENTYYQLRDNWSRFGRVK